MAKRDFTKRKWEKWGASAAACLVGAVCIMTGVYIDEMSDVKDKGYVVDLSDLDQSKESDKKQTKEQDKTETELPPANIVNSNKVVNSPQEAPKIEKGIDDLDALDIPEVEKEVETAQVELKEAVKDAPLTFGIDRQIDWPVQGEVALDYCMDHTVFFPTLNQYKYNPAMYICGKEGDEVISPCEAEVAKVAVEDEVGNYVVLNLGDGYEVNLGQVKDISVSEGERVARGQVIAHLAKATKYHANEGDSLRLAMTKDGNSVNPRDFLISQ